MAEGSKDSLLSTSGGNSEETAKSQTKTKQLLERKQNMQKALIFISIQDTSCSTYLWHADNHHACVVSHQKKVVNLLLISFSVKKCSTNSVI